jgi:hypothetical protein
MHCHHFLRTSERQRHPQTEAPATQRRPPTIWNVSRLRQGPASGSDRVAASTAGGSERISAATVGGADSAELFAAASCAESFIDDLTARRTNRSSLRAFK